MIIEENTNTRDIDLKEELRQEMMQEAREEEIHERKMYEDWDYVIDYMNFNSEMTVEDFNIAINQLKDKYGWHISNKDMLELLEFAVSN